MFLYVLGARRIPFTADQLTSGLKAAWIMPVMSHTCRMRAQRMFDPVLCEAQFIVNQCTYMDTQLVATRFTVTPEFPCMRR